MKMVEQNKITIVMLAMPLLLTACAVGPSSAVKNSKASDFNQADAYELGNLLVKGVPPIPAHINQQLLRYQNTRSAAFRGWLGASALLSTRFGEVNQLHLVHTPMGAREQVTFFKEPVSTVAIQPGGSGNFIYFKDIGGSEYYQHFFYDAKTGKSQLLTDGASKYGELVWSPDGLRIAYTSMQRNGTDKDIYVRTFSRGQFGSDTAVLVSQNTAWWEPMGFSRDGAHLLVQEYLSNQEAYLYELDIKTGELRALLDPELKMMVEFARYSVDGQSIYFSADIGAEFMRLHRLDLASGTLEVLSEDIDWDVESFTLSEDGRWLAFSANEGGWSRLHALHLPGREFVALPKIPNGLIGGLRFRPDGSELGFSLNRPTQPADIYSIDMNRRTLQRWTKSEVGGLDTDNFVAPLLVHYPSFDSATGPGSKPRMIPAFVYSPDQPGRHPVVVRIHGGPEGQSRPWFSYITQYLVKQLGVTVITPNVRGSNGYGKTYLNLDNGYLREDSVKDIGALLDWIATEPGMDADRVAVMGGSYGGYMVLASLVHYSDRLRAGVDSVGISNFVSFLEHTRSYRRDMRRAEYGDERISKMRDFLEEISPLTHVEKIRAPLHISQGLNDPRVPASESDQIYQALKRADIPTWYVLAKDEGHGFKKKTNRDFNNAATMLFLEKYLLAND